MSAEERSGAGILPFGDEDEVRGYLEVTVTDTISRPISGATVKLFLGGTVAEGKTDSNGKVTFSALAYLTYRLEVEKEGYAKASQDVYVREGTNQVIIRLYYLVTVTVLDNSNNNPIAGATVTFSWTEDDIEKIVSEKTDSQGKAVLGVPYYTQRMVVEKEGYTTYSSDSVIIDGPGKNITVKLNPTTSPTPRGTLIVRVRDTKPTPSPIPDATVRVFRGTTKVDEKKTDNNGQVTFDLEANVTYSLEIEKAGYAKKTLSHRVTPGTNEVPVYLYYLVTVTVLDNSNNNPIAGATVTFYWLDEEGIFSGVTDSQGKVVLELTHRDYELYVEKAGYATHYAIVSIDRPDINITVRLIPATFPMGTLAIRVFDTKSPRSPIPDATVRVFQHSTKIGEKTTDNFGLATFVLRANLTYDVEIEKAGYAKSSSRRYVIEGVNRADEYLQYLVTVTVLDNTNNRPIAGAKVTFSWTEGGTQRSVSKDTDSQGRAVFELSHRSYNLSVSRDGYAPYSGSVTVDEPNENITVKLNPLPPLVVIAVQNVPKNPPRIAISDARVVVRRDGQEVTSGTTDQNGRVSLRLPSPGTYQITASKDGYRSGSTNVNFPDRTEVTVELVAIGLELQVEVVNSQTGAPISGATVTVKKGNDPVTSGTTNNNGLVTFRLDSDEYTIEAQAQGFHSGSKSVVLAQNQQKERVALNPASQPPQPRHNLTVTVTFKNRPVSEATVTVSRGGQPVESKTTGADGKVTFQLEQGTYTVQASKSGYKPADPVDVNLTKDENIPMALRGYTVTVTVRDQQGNLVSGATVRILDQNNNEVDSGMTG